MGRSRLVSNRRDAHSTISNLIIVFGLLIAFFTAHVAYAQLAAGTITAINGNATITRAGRSFAAAYSAPIDVGDQIVTAPNGRLTVTLSDGSQLELTESSTLLVSQHL